jgi:bromodomain-containing factor 1
MPSPSEQELISKIKSDLELLPSSLPFLLPVDPQSHGCPDYYEIIKDPIDISSMNPSCLEEFIKNILLMLGNCYRYNPKGHFIRVLQA